MPQFVPKLAPTGKLPVDQGLTLTGIPPRRRVRLDLVLPSQLGMCSGPCSEVRAGNPASVTGKGYPRSASQSRLPCVLSRTRAAIEEGIVPGGAPRCRAPRRSSQRSRPIMPT